MTMKNFKKYAPWIIAVGAIAVAVGTRRFYMTKTLLELPTYKFAGEIHTLLPSVGTPMIYKLKDGQQLALYTVEAAAEALAKAV
jgi:hypothetical protein